MTSGTARSAAEARGTVATLIVDAADLASMLSLLSDAAGQRGDGDSQRALRLLQRHAERLGEAIEMVSLDLLNLQPKEEGE